MENATKLGDQIEKISHKAGNELGHAMGDASNLATHYTKEARNYIESNPLQSVAIAAAGGLLLGSFLTMVAIKKS